MTSTPAADCLTIINADVLEGLKRLPSNSVQCCVTSPPYYGLRSYLKADDPAKATEIGAEQTPQQYVDRMVEVFREVKRVLREDGVLWLNLGDSYGDSYGGSSGVHAGGSDKARSNAGAVNATLRAKGGRSKNLLMIPARVALALQQDGWYLRAACPWIKRNGMPESVKDRPAQTIEMLYMLTKRERYHYDAEAVKVDAKPESAERYKYDFSGAPEGSMICPGDAEGQRTRPKGKKTFSAKRVRRSGDWFFESWQGMLHNEEGDPLAFVVNTKPYKGAHFAVFPPDLVRPCIQSGISAHGSCPDCGAPYQRIIVKTDTPDPSHKGSRFDTGKTGSRDGGDRTQAGKRFLTETTGWQPTCSHTHTHTHTHTLYLVPFSTPSAAAVPRAKSLLNWVAAPSSWS